MEMARIYATGGHRKDRWLATAVGATFAVALVLGPLVLKPWGPATPQAVDGGLLWSQVPLVIDFKAYWTAASLVRDGAGHSLYDLEVQRAFQLELDRTAASPGVGADFTGYAPFLNPPPLALLFAPLTLLPMAWAFLAWSAVSLAAFAGAVALPLRGRPFACTTAVVMLTYVGVADTLLWGQVNGLFTLVFSLGLLALSAGRPILGGLVLGLLWVKPPYALLLPVVFLFKGRWRELGGMVATGVGIAGLSLAIVGPDGLARFLALMREVGAFYSPPSTSTAAERMVNWRGVVVHLWPGVPEATGYALMLALGGATVLASLLVLRGPWKPSSPRFGLQMLALALATIVVSPHSHFHSTVLLLAPLAMIGLRTENAALSAQHPALAGSSLPGSESWWRPLLWFGYLLALVIWPFRVLSWLLVPYFLLVMALLILLTRPARGG